MIKHFTLGLSLFLVFLSQIAYCENNQAIQTLYPIITIVTGDAVNESFVRTNEAEVIQKHCNTVLKSLKAEGIHTNDLAIYSLAFSINVESSSIHYADILEKPDICFLINIEDVGLFMIRNIYIEYSGKILVEHVIGTRSLQGKKVKVHVLDDDTLSKDEWPHILKDRVEYKFNDSVFCTKLTRVTHDVGGDITWLDSRRRLDKPDILATAEFKIPKSQDGRWLADGIIRDFGSEDIGILQFGQMWRADHEKLK